jgi:hypothetical protein
MVTRYTVHFQKGTRAGARTLRLVHVDAASVGEAIKKAKVEFKDRAGFKVTRVDRFDGVHVVRVR